MPPKKKVVPKSNAGRIANFHRRWNIELSEKERWESLRSRLLNAYADIVSYVFIGEGEEEDEFFNTLGIHTRRVIRVVNAGDNISGLLSESSVYTYFYEQHDMKKFLLGIEVLFWLNVIGQEARSRFAAAIQEAIEITGVPLEMKLLDDEVVFYPAGAKLLDEKLVNDNLNWLSGYANAYKPFRSALEDLGVKGKERNVLDQLRLSLELLLKELLGNGKSLENQQAALGAYLKDKDTSPEIAQLYWKVVDFYCKYQNDKAKHGDNAKPDEVEFMLYQTGAMMRFLLTK